MKKNAIMMQKLQKLCGLVLTLVLWSGIALAQETAEPVKGLLRVKLQSELTEEGQPVATRSGIARTGRKSIDAMNSRLKVSSMKRMFPYAPKYEDRMRKHGLHLWYEVRYDENISPAEAAQAFRSVAEVEKVDIVRPMVLMDGSHSVGQDVTSSAIPTSRSTSAFNDPMLKKQWHYSNDGSIPGTIAGSDINLFKAWEITAGTKDVIVAIIDGGVDYNHEDLKGQIWINEAELNGVDGVDDDGNGYIDDVYGWNFIRNSNLIYPHEHGTHVAGTVGAINNNGIGVCGVAGGTGNQDGVTLMSCQVFDIVPGDGATEFAKSIVYAANNGAVIAQCSWGWNVPDHSEASVEEAIRYFIAEAGNYEGSPMKGGVCFFATGNLGIHGDFYPAAMPEVVAVGAMTADFKVAAYTNNGSTVDILAPGGDGEFDQRLAVFSTKPHNTYGYLDGTSMATPHVSGVAALVLSKFGGKNFTNENLKNHILTAVKDIYPNNPDWIGRAGRGYLDAELALHEDQQKAPEQITDFQLLASQEDIGVEWTVPDDEDDHQIEKHLIYSSTKAFTAESDLSTLQVTEVDSKFEKTGSVLLKEVTDLTPATEYWIAIQAVDRWGNKSQLSPVKSTKTNSGPVVTLDKEYGMNLMVDVSNTYTASDVLTATNEGEGLLKWEAILRQKSQDYFPPMLMNGARSATLIPYSGQIQSRAREIQEIVKADFMEEDFPKSISYYKEYAYDIGEMDDPTLTNSMAQYYHIATEDFPEGFNLTHLAIEGINPLGGAVIEIYGDSKSVTTAPLLLSDTLPSVNYEKEIVLSSQLHFGPEEGFWLVIHLGPQNAHAFGIGEQSSTGYTAYCLYSNDLGKTWSTLYDVLKNSNISAMADKAVYTVKAVSKYPDLQGYIAVTPAEGKTSPGKSATITLETQQMDIPDGSYEFNLLFNCNEAGHKQRTVPVYLTVSGHKPVLNTARVINFGDVFVGKSKTLQVEIVNSGYGNFGGEWGDYTVNSSDPQFQVDMEQLNYMLPQLKARSRRTLPITYTPTSAGTHTSNITMTEMNGTTHQFTVRGIADEPAHIEYTPAVIDAGELVYGAEPKTFEVQIRNTGNYPLEYIFPHFTDDSLSGLTHTSHKFGYSYISNLTDPSGYVYKWEDLVNATDIADQINDDNILSGAIDLGFNFSYYGKTYNKIYISSYGAVSVTGEGFELMMCRQTLSSDPLCTAGMGLISALGMPLQFDKGSKLLYAKQNGQFIISYENALLQTWNGFTPVSFRIVLSENGDIEMYFRDYDITQFNNGGQDIFVGFTDINVEDPFVITDIDQVLNSNFTNQTFTLFGNERAIRIIAPGSNMIQSITPPAGIVAAGDTQIVTLTVAADTTMYTGELKNIVTLLSTDPDKSTSYITMNATISGDRYKPLVELSTDRLDLGTQFRTSTVKGAVSIKNAGHSPVNLTDVKLANGEMTLSLAGTLPYELMPGTSIDAIITVPSDQSREFEDVLTVVAANGQTLTANINAKIIGNPAISLTPQVITETIAAGTSKGMTQQIANTGDEPLSFTIQHHSYYYPTNTISSADEEYDYTYASSLNDKNVVYEWEDITETGKHTRLDYLAIHDYVKVPIPDKFIFYGQAFDTMYIYGNGFLTFQSYIDGNYLMPSPPVNIPDVTNIFINYIAPFWGMHAPAESSTSGIYYEIKDDRIIVSFMEYGNVVNSGQNAQVILYNTGKIKFQYCIEEDGQLTTFFGIAGLENGDHTKGIKLPARYVAMEQAVELYPVKKITLQPGSSKQIPMILDVKDILAGQYNENVLVTTNVPAQEETNIPLSLNVTGQAQPVFPDKMDFGDIMVGNYNPEKMQMNFEVSNTGTAAFHITDFYMKNSGYTCNLTHLSNGGGGDIPMPGVPGLAEYYGDPIEVGKEAQKFLVSFAMPFSAPEMFKDTIVFVTDLPHSTINIPMYANAVNPPEMSIDQKDINLYAAVDTAVIDSVIVISNLNGQYKLDYTVTLESSSTAITTTAQTASTVPAQAATTIVPTQAVKLQQAATTYADEDLYPDTEFLRELRYETTGKPVGFLGTGDEVTSFQAITVYTAPSDGFNIYAIECYATLKDIEGDIKAEIQVGDSYLSAQTIGQGSLHISDDKEDFRFIRLDHPVYLNPNETFYVRLTFPIGVTHPLGIITTTDQDVTERYYGYIGEQWIDLINFEGTLGIIGYMMRCLEIEAGSPWISISKNATGSIATGETGQFTIHVNAKTARYMKGNQATVQVTGDVDPEGLKHTFKVTLDKNYGPEITRLTEDIDLQEDATAEVKFKVVDREEDTFTVDIEDNNHIAKAQLNQNDLTVTLHPAFGQAGNQSFTVVATDQYNNESRHTVDYYVKKNNRAPIVLAKPEAIKNNLGTVIEPLDLSLIFSDPDGDPLTYTVKSSDESVALGFTKDGFLEFTQKAQGETEISITATDPYGLSVTTSVDLELLRSKNASESDKITVYPNPVVYLLTINSPASIEGETLVRIYNMGGTLVYSEKTVMGLGITKTLDMADFPSGMYVLELECEGEKMSTKIVKQ